ncbi:MAG: DDE-type integrase/transposase/recombinase [Candidatus Methanomethylicia archaeon]
MIYLRNFQKKLKYRKCIAINETKLKIKKKIVYIWFAIDIDSKEILVLKARYGRSCIDALIFLRKVLKLCKNKPKIIIDKGQWYIWALNKLGLEYEHKTFGIRNRIERFFKYLKERTIVFS